MTQKDFVWISYVTSSSSHSGGLHVCSSVLRGAHHTQAQDWLDSTVQKWRPQEKLLLAKVVTTFFSSVEESSFGGLLFLACATVRPHNQAYAFQNQRKRHPHSSFRQLLGPRLPDPAVGQQQQGKCYDIISKSKERRRPCCQFNG